MLDGNRERLKDLGILYPQSARPEASPTGHHVLFWSLRGKHGVVGHKAWFDLLKEISRDSTDAVVISAEGLSVASDDEIAVVRDYLEEFRVKIVVYLRNQLDFLISSYKQNVKGRSMYCDSFQKYVEDNVHLCNYCDLLTRWQAFFGADAIVPRVFDKVKGNELYSDFLSLIGVPSEGFHFPKSANISPTEEATCALRALNKIYKVGFPIRSIWSGMIRSVKREDSKGRLAIAFLSTIVENKIEFADSADFLYEAVDGWNQALFRDWLPLEDQRYFTLKPINAS